MKTIFTFFLGCALLLTSCTVVTSTNIPGKQVDAFPKKLIGKYEIQYPTDFAALADPNTKSWVTITKTEVITTTAEGDNTSTLGDSLYLSKIGKQHYLCIGATPHITVFKLVRMKKDLALYPMFSGDAIAESALSPYFSSVREIPGEPDENGEIGPPSFEVTIIDDKLDDYFDSSLPYKTPLY